MANITKIKFDSGGEYCRDVSSSYQLTLNMLAAKTNAEMSATP
jgi:hypothetical protein